MRNRIMAAWDVIRTSLWLVPSLMIIAGSGLAALMLAIDAGRGAEDDLHAWWMNKGGPEDARDLLSTLLNGVIAMAAMVFSATVVALTLAANQYGPRLVRVFRSDIMTQVALGTFAMTIVYLVLVLRTIRRDAELHDVPHAAVSLGTALALACVLALLLFLQEVARTAVADDVVARVGRELDTAIESLPPLPSDKQETPACPGDPACPAEWDLWKAAGQVAQRQEGYVQAMDYDRLLAWAEQHDAVLRLDFRAGDFVAAGDRRIHVSPASVSTAAERDAICEAATIGRERTPTQDLEFSIRHLVEVAVRALSPGTNDPFTAMVVIDQLRGSLTRLAARELPPPILWDRAGQVRVVRETTNYAGIVDAAFHQIRQAGASHPAIVIHLLEAIARMADHARSAEQREALNRHAQMIAAAGLREATEPRDQRDIERSLTRAQQALSTGKEAAQPAPNGCVSADLPAPAIRTGMRS